MTRDRINGLITLALLLLLVATLVAGSTAHMQTVTLGDMMPEVYAARTGTTHLTVSTIVRIGAVPILRDGWVGYEHGGFDWPSDYTNVEDVFLQTVPGDWLSGMLEVRGRKDDPDVLLVLVYDAPEDLIYGGNPPGTHPTGGAWVVARDAWMDAVNGE